MASFPKRRGLPRLLCTGILLLCSGQGRAFSIGANRPSTLLSRGSNGRSTSAVTAEPSTAHALQRVWDELVDGAELQDVEKLLTGVKTGLFPQASAWAKTWTPMRCVVAEVGDSRSISILVLPREYDTPSRVSLGQYRHKLISQRSGSVNLSTTIPSSVRKSLPRYICACSHKQVHSSIVRVFGVILKPSH